ncbi:MAG TPA: type II toxin-antitoxin system RelE/ParE family toxin [Rhodanobacteraceae bacterium]|nr:type II toxin-antitoxin system RelE/ParE family toxin [Rhodanobacteraceae bacterium]
MSHQLRFTQAALEDVERLYRFLAEQDSQAADAAIHALEKAWELLSIFPLSARKADPANPFLRELLITFGSAGYVALFQIEDDTTITILAIRHQREDDYH